jgi:hypothetical protein
LILGAEAVQADNAAETISVDANANRHAISPLIYGANIWSATDADTTTLINDLNITVNRRGGNATTTYNWQVNATNRGGDWFFESSGDSNGSSPSAGPDGAISATKAAGAEILLTIPIVDWVAKLGPNRQGLTPYSVAKYGAQTKTDPWWPDAGNGVLVSTGSRITDNDPNDAYAPNSPTFQQQWVQYLVNKFGSSSNNGVKYYIMDNEPGVWPSNHRPIMPVGQTMEQMRDRIIAYATAVKSVDPNAQVIGSEEWGWTNYLKSPYDTYTGGNTDRNAHGNMDYQAWLLQALKANNDATGKRLLDVFSLHYYPQYSEFDQGDSSTAAQLKRNESTRDLWDPNYVSSSWIASKIQLIPRMKNWVNTYYPGTKIAITEYSWGAGNHISGAIAQADVLGILGREGVDIATLWGGLSDGYPIRNSFKIYRNYDGNKSTFGDTSVSATVVNPDNVAAFAAQRSADGALTVMVVCKYLTANTPLTVHLANFAAGSKAQVWQFTSANTINRLADATVSNGNVSFSAPAQSVTLFVIPGAIALTDDITARYAFEGDAQDTSGNGNHGTATSVSYTTGKIGAQAAQFDGSSSNVTIPKSVTDDFTVAMWVKTTDTAGAAGAQWWAGKALVDGEVAGGAADWGTAIVNGKFVLGVGASGGDVTVPSSVNINDGTWHHVVATRANTSGAMAVYVDGVSRGTGTGPTGSRSAPPAFRIGASQPGWSAFLNGTLDDVRLYNRILSPTEITALASGAKPTTPTGVAAIPGNGSIALNWPAPPTATGYDVKRATTSGGPYTTVGAVTSPSFLDANLTNGTTYYYVVSAVNTYGETANSAEVSLQPGIKTLHLKFDEASGATAADSSGYGFNATLVNGPTFAAGKINNALGFASASSQYATLPTGIVSALGDFTVSAWVKPTTLDSWARVFDFGSGTNTYMYLTTKSGDLLKPRFAIKIGDGAEQQINAGSALPTGVWTHVAVTLSGTTGTLYINGVADGTNSTITSTPSAMGATTQNYLGKSQWNDPYLNGALDDFRVYSRALSASEITQLAAGQLPAPQNVAATPGSGKITLSWSAVSNASDYTIQRASTSGGSYSTLTNSFVGTSYNDAGLVDGVTWYYTIAANGFSGTGLASAPVSATTYTAVENWRLANFGTVASTGNAADSADPDGDGLSNTKEFTSGTDPNSAASALKIAQVQTSGSNLVVSFPSVSGKTYRVERSDTLQSGSWATVQDNIAGTGGTIQITDTGAAAQSKRFYRVVAW